MQEEYKVLNHGYVRYQGHLGGEEDIIRAARMSTDKGFLGWGAQHTDECLDRLDRAVQVGIITGWSCRCPRGDEKLLEYLYSHKHMTPFEMLELRVEVKAPIFVFREWHRHRTFSYNEMSARYVQMPNEHYVPGPRLQDTKNKQGSVSGVIPLLNRFDIGEGEETLTVEEEIEREQQLVYGYYEQMVERGIAKEVARINTPVSRYSKMWAKANLRNWLQFLQLRLALNAQLEIRLYAQAVASIIKEIWPRTYELFEEYTLNSLTLSATEAAMYREIMNLQKEKEEKK